MNLVLSFISFTAFETKELAVREKNVMFLSCSLFDKWDAVRNAAALSCPSWLGVTRQQMEFGDEQMWMFLQNGSKKWGLGREKHWRILHTVLFSSKKKNLSAGKLLGLKSF